MPCAGEPTPGDAGTSDSFTVTELFAATTYYFALKVADEVPNWSGLSNVEDLKTLVSSDSVPPIAVSDLEAGNPKQSTIQVTWTAPGDDSTAGAASEYDIRYSLSSITEVGWDGATMCTGEPHPGPAGSAQVFVLTGLLENTTYFVALRSRDEVPNWSGLSNVASATTTPAPDTEPPARVTDLWVGAVTLRSISLSWTAPGDDGDLGIATEYDLRYSTSDLSEAVWSSATRCLGVPAPDSAGHYQSHTVTGLQPDTAYYFALKAGDEAPNWSAMSNVATAQTSQTCACDEGHIVYCKGGQGDIYVMCGDGTCNINLTGSSWHEHAPALSPDGQKIAFLRDLGMGHVEIFLMDSDGSNVEQITHSPSLWKNDITFTPDGNGVVYSVGRSPYVVDLADGTERPWTTTPGFPHFSRDGSRVVYLSEDESKTTIGIWVADGDGGNAAFLLEDEGVWDEESPEISPNGSRIVFGSTRHHVSNPQEPHYYNTEIYIMDADGKNLTRLTFSDPADDYIDSSPDHDPCFSPDGTMIAFFSRQGGGTGIWTMTLDGQDRKELTGGSTYAPHWGH